MLRSRMILWSMCISAIVAGPGVSTSVRAQSVDAMLNAPGWDVAYTVEFNSSDTGTIKSLHGPVSFTRSVKLTSSVTLALDMRNMGSTLAMTHMLTGADAKSADLQQKMLDLTMRSESMANWMSSGVQFKDNASDSEQMAAVTSYMESSKGPGSVDFSMTEKGDNLVDETGSKYSMTRTTTSRGAGTVVGPTQLMFEIDAQSKTYLLMLACSFSDKSDSTVLTEVVTVTTRADAIPETTRESSRSPLGKVPGLLRLNDPKLQMGEVPLMQGTLDPLKTTVTGERSVKGYYESAGQNVPGTFVFRYTLTPRM